MIAAVLAVVALGADLAPVSAASAPRAWSSIGSWAYWLDSPDAAQLARSPYQLIVTDELSRNQVSWLRAGRCHPRVVAYLSIGEAEDYRWYWQNVWQPGSPAWLGEENPDWAGNYAVNFWDPAWQRIVLQSVDRLVDLGYDGVYLDKVDAYEDLGHRTDMAWMIKAIAARARRRSALHSDFGVIVQNAEELAAAADVVGAITGIGREETYVAATDVKVPAAQRRAVERWLDVVKAKSQAGLVLTVDYASSARLASDAETSARAKHYVPYVTNVDLDRLSSRPAPPC